MAEIVGATVVEAHVPEQVIAVEPTVAPRPVQIQQDPAVDPSLPARTTFQEDLTTAGQRYINSIWEWTQAAIALMVVAATMAVGVVSLLQGKDTIPTIYSVAFGTVVGFYFARTNHTAVGGTGRKPPEPPYTGRSILVYLGLAAFVLWIMGH